MPADRIHYIPPGLHPQDFLFHPGARERIRRELYVNEQVVIMTAAMFRPGVKTEGIRKVISSCQQLVESGCNILLILAGDGSNRQFIEKIAGKALAKKAIFLGRIDRAAMPDYYSAADIFAFPGIEESLGMVYLEAQACGLPVAAYADWGAKAAVIDQETGLLSPAAEQQQFTENLQRLVNDKELRRRMGYAATAHVMEKHNIQNNYGTVWEHLKHLVSLAKEIGC